MSRRGKHEENTEGMVEIEVEKVKKGRWGNIGPREPVDGRVGWRWCWRNDARLLTTYN